MDDPTEYVEDAIVKAGELVHAFAHDLDNQQEQLVDVLTKLRHWGMREGVWFQQAIDDSYRNWIRGRNLMKGNKR